MSLFGSSGPKNLVEFRAGKMFRDGNLVKPDTRKGQLYAYEVRPLWKDFSWFSRDILVENREVKGSFVKDQC